MTRNQPVGPSNPGMPLDLVWVQQAIVNLSAVQRRAATHKTRRSVKKAHQAAWLLRATTCTDLTTLAGDDTESNVRRLCAKAQNPVRQDLLEKIAPGLKITRRRLRLLGVRPVGRQGPAGHG